MPHHCSVINCRGNYKGQPKVSIFSFPKDPNLCQKWLDRLGRKDFKITSNSKICRRHFLNEDILTQAQAFDEKKGKLIVAPLMHPRLRKGAVPVLNMDNTREKQQSTKKTPNGKRARIKSTANSQLDISEKNNEFVKPFANETQRNNNIPKETTTPITSECQSSNKNAKKRKITGFQAELLGLIKESMSQTDDEKDDDKAFLMSLLPILKKFDDNQKLTVQTEIIKAIRKVQLHQQPLSMSNSLQQPIIIHVSTASRLLESPLYAIRSSPKHLPSDDEYDSEYERSSMQGAMIPSTSNYLRGGCDTNSLILSNATDPVSIKDEDTSVFNYE